MATVLWGEPLRERKFDVWCTYGDARTIKAVDAETAAMLWASEQDSRSVGGQTVKVTVRTPDGEIKFFQVTGESVPQYHAREV